jgi:hypothetical protein
MESAFAKEPRGHWEGDLLSGAKNSYIATLVEHHSRFAILIKVPSKETEVVVDALSRHVRKLPATLRRSLTSTPPEKLQAFKFPRVAASKCCVDRLSRQRLSGLLSDHSLPAPTSVTGACIRCWGRLHRGVDLQP